MYYYIVYTLLAHTSKPMGKGACIEVRALKRRVVDTQLRNCCTNFVKTFSHENKSDVELNDFLSELQVLQMTLPDDLMSATEILQFVTVADCYPNVSIAYRILLTIPVTVASAERSFSKLKLLKNYLRSTMLPDTLNGLAMCY